MPSLKKIWVVCLYNSIKSNPTSRQYYGQTLSLEKGKTYTFSSYVKTSNISNTNGGGAGLFVLYQNSAGTWQTVDTAEHITGTQDWQRMEVSFTIPADAAATTVYARAGILNESGTAWFDALQLEGGTIANRYNLVENPSLTNGAGTPTSWTKNSNADANDTLIKETTPSATLDGGSFRINGDAAKQKNLYQVINVSGLKNDVFSVGGWAKGNSVPLVAGRYFAIDVGLQKTDGTFDWYVVPFNEDSSEWQYVSDKIVAKNAYKAACFYVIYYNNLNSAYFDNLQLYKEEFEESYQYDTKGNVISTKDLAAQESKFEYNGNNDLTKTITHNGFSYTFNYDSLGNVTSVSVGTQNLISNSYDLQTGRFLESTYGNGQRVSSDYDNLDRVTADKYNGEVRYKYQYDGAGNLGFHEDLVNGVNYRYIYDLSDRLVKVTDTKGNTLTYGYDKDNNVDKVTEKIGSETYVTSYAFDNDNRIKTITIPNSTNTISYAYDSIGRLKTSTIVIGTSQFVITNNYDAGGKLQSVNLPGGRSISYTYDANGNIETITESGKINKYYYNELNELIREDNQILDKTIAYSYDVGGNILNKIEYAYTTDAALSNQVNTISYDYGDANWKDKITAYNGKPITYDNIGNPLTYDGYTYTWEEGRQLKTITGNGLDISFKYNSEGIRTEKKVGDVVTKYHLVGDKVTFEDNGTDKIYYTYGSDRNLVSMNLNDVEYYYVRNGQGDIIGLLDGSGAEVVSYLYDSWGKLVSTTGTLKDTLGAKNPYRYRGYRYDSETGYYYLQSRYYNPEWGRFINTDAIAGSIGELLGHNIFLYCKNNPVNMFDPNGYREVIIDGGIEDEIFLGKMTSTRQNIIHNIDTKNPPPAKTGYKSPKNPDKAKKRIPAPGARGETGWLDKKGNVWVPDIDMDGGEGWRRHYPDGSHDHVYPNGKVRSHNSIVNPLSMNGAERIIIPIFIIYEITKMTSTRPTLSY